MTSSAKSEWLIPSGLIALIFVPVLAGVFRLIELGGGAEITPDNARFFAAPVPVVLHIISVGLYGVLGAFQFASGFRHRNPRWHRTAGQILVPSGLIVALSGLWMTQFYPPVDGDGPILYVFRLATGSAMVLFIGLGVAAIWRRRFSQHGAWMMRGYAIGLGAGTQFLIFMVWFLLVGPTGELSKALIMGAGWAINLALAEWIIRRQPAHGANTHRSSKIHIAAVEHFTKTITT